MKKSYLFSILFLTGLLILIIWLMARQYSSPIISLLPSGFSPPELTIKKGQTVTFITKRNKPFWPASNVHPLHSLYPEFDPKKPIEANQSWSFTFDKAGKWKYHDHTAPYFRGVIIVRGQDSTVSFVDPCQTKIEKITDANIRLQCWSDQIEQVLKSKGLDQSLELLASLYESQPDFAVNCHDSSHSLGDAAYKLFAQGKTVTFSPKTTYCGYGFYHGLMETILQIDSNPKAAYKFCQKVTEKLPLELSDACYHGIGHGAVDVSDPKIWGDGQAMIDRALGICQSGYNQEEQLVSCARGVFMEIASYYSESLYNLSIDKNDPLSICRQQQKIFKGQCYSQMYGVISRITNKNLRQGAKYIEFISEDEYAQEAIQNQVGIEMDINKQEHTDDILTCRMLQERLRLNCIKGLVQAYMLRGKPGFESEQALTICSHPILTQNEKTICFNHLLDMSKKVYVPAKFKQVCDGIEVKYRGIYCN